MAIHRAADAGFCLTRGGLWLEGSEMRTADCSTFPRRQLEAPSPSQCSREPVLAQPQKSLLPHSIGYKRGLNLQRFREGGSRPRPGGKSIKDIPWNIWQATWACLWETPSSHAYTFTLQQTSDTMSICHIHRFKKAGCSSQRQGLTYIPRFFEA